MGGNFIRAALPCPALPPCHVTLSPSPPPPPHPSIIPLTRSKYTQFLVFYVCQMTPSYPDAFVGRMVNICLDGSNSPVTRQYAAAYLGSFLSRAVYIKDTTLYVAWVAARSG